VHKYGVGVVTSTEIIASTLDDTLHEERGRRLRYALIDFTRTTELRVTPSMLPKIVEISRKSASFSPGVYVAVVAPNPFAFAMSRIWQSFADSLGLNASVFNNRDEAVAWLKGKLLKDGAPEEYPSLTGATRRPAEGDQP
jgi:hypothetical protein